MDKSMLNIYIVRHGETMWNLDQRLQGHKDSPLTKRGIEEAINTGQNLSSISFLKIFSSPSKRAFDTANYINTQNSEIILDKRLMEMNMGDWEGRLWGDIIEENSKEYTVYKEKPENFEAPNGEALKAVNERVKSFFKDFLNKFNEGNYLIITHGLTLKIINMYFNEIPLKYYWDVSLPINNSITKVSFNGGKFVAIEEGEVFKGEKSNFYT